MEAGQKAANDENTPLPFPPHTHTYTTIDNVGLVEAERISESVAGRAEAANGILKRVSR